MKYIIGFMVLLVAIFALYSFTVAPEALKDVVETGQIEQNNQVPVETQEQPTEQINKDNNKDNMQEVDNTITKATFKTNLGDITIELYTEDAPNTVANFVKLAGEGFYDGIKFHRVIKGFMIQSGDPLSKVEGAAWGTGGPGYQFADEIHTNNKNNKYTLAMANSGPNTNGSQFFINTNDNNFLDSKHTVFGKVVSGTDTVDKIENTATGDGDRPIEPVIIESIVLE